MAEEHGREDENDQGPQGQEQSQAQDLQELGGKEIALETPWKALGEVWKKVGVGRAIAKPLLHPLPCCRLLGGAAPMGT